MKARKRFSRVVASTLTLALLLGMLPMAAFAADPDYAPTVAELKNMTRKMSSMLRKYLFTATGK